MNMLRCRANRTVILLVLGVFMAIWPAKGREIVCPGSFGGHLQGIAVDGKNAIFWSHTVAVTKTDMEGHLLRKVQAPSHQGDLTYHDGKVYVAVNLRAFNQPAGQEDSWVYVYDADNLSLLSKHSVIELVHGAGGIAWGQGRFIVVGGLPDTHRQNYLYEYDEEFRFIRRHVLDSGYTDQGIQTAAYHDGYWWFGCYGNTLLKTDESFHLLGRYQAAFGVGIVGIGPNRYLRGQGFADSTRGKAVVTYSPGKKVYACAVEAIVKRQILPDFEPPDAASDLLAIRACRGEFEPASFVAIGLEADVRLEVRTTDLKGASSVIPAQAVDIRTVKRWYQAGDQRGDGAPTNLNKQILTPELLLKNDGLIKVDHQAKKNYVKLTFPDGTTQWRWLDDSDTPHEDFSVETCPIRDAKTLQPMMIRHQTAKQFWVTVHVPQNAAPGPYKGNIELRSADALLSRLDLQLEVLPFDLEPNPLESSIYFHWGLSLVEGQATADYKVRNRRQYRAELENLLSHGVDNPTVGVPFATGLLPEVLKMRREVGMKQDYLYCLIEHTDSPPEKITTIIELAKSFGFEDVYFYGSDEAYGEALKHQRPEWKKVRQAGGKIFVAGRPNSNSLHMADIQDLMIRCYTPNADETAVWHRHGHKIFAYGNPQSGLEDPETYRRNYGLLLAVSRYHGAMNFIYYEGWNDYNIGRLRQHNFVYPTADGVLDTIQWEGYREGIDDLRYWATLRKLIEKSRPTQAVKEAQEFLDDMQVTSDLLHDGLDNTNYSPGTDCGQLRHQMIEFILRLGNDL